MQREIFEPPGLRVKPKEDSREPRLWFRRFVIWPEPGADPIQDTNFGPGLNIIWSPDPVDRSSRDRDEAPSGAAHGAGKTVVCRLLRYCLGEPHFASDLLRRKIGSAFKDGRVGAEVIVDGKAWAVVRSIGVFSHDVVVEGAALERAVSPETAPTGMTAFVDMLAERFVTPDVASMIANSPQNAWLLALAWLARDQECHFGKPTEWRAAGSESGSPARRLSAGDATNVVRALLGALTPREHKLEAEIEALGKQRDEEGRDIERRQWLMKESIDKFVRALRLDRKSLPDGDLLAPFLRNAVRSRVASISIAGAKGEFASVEDLVAKYETARDDVRRLKDEVSAAETARSTAAAVAQQIASETPGLSASLDEAELPVCPVCEVPIDRALADGCKLSHKLPDVASLRQRREKNERDYREKCDEQRKAEKTSERLRQELAAASEEAQNAWDEFRAAERLRSERAEAWYAARRMAEDITDLERLLAETSQAEKALARTNRTLEKSGEAVANERDRHGHVFSALGKHFDPLVRRFVGRESGAVGRIGHDGNGLHLVVEYGGERSTPAIDLVKVLAFDIATLCRSIEGATRLPAFLIHDSPRSSDLGLSIYHELFRIMRELEDVGEGPQFQYIVTTTSRPPDELVADDRLRLKLKGSPADARLLRRDL